MVCSIRPESRLPIGGLPKFVGGKLHISICENGFNHSWD
jgi:hypothetical protein